MTKQANNNHYFVFDILRGISALLVCANHLRSALFTSYGSLTSSNIFDRLFYFATSLGHQSVIVFFVISGFLIGGAIIKNKDNFKTGSYSINRLTRLYTVLVPALLLTAIVDYFLSSSHPEALGRYYVQWSSGPTVENYSSSLLTFIGNFFFLQNIFVSTFGTNSPLWSLSYEFWYYVAFPLLLIPLLALLKKIKTETHSAAHVALLAIAGLILVLMPFETKVGFLIWIVGAIIVLFRKRQFPTFLKLVSFVIFIASLLSLKVAPVKDLNPHLQDLYLTSTFAFFLITNLNSTYTLIHKIQLITKIINFLSNISFTLYLFHFPLIVLLATKFVGKTPLQPNLQGYLTYSAFLTVILIVCYSMWWIFERNTAYVKNMVSRKQ